MKRQGGFGIITVIAILLILAVLSGGMVALSTTQHNTLSQDVLSARAEQAARAGVQWGLFQAFSGTAAWGGATCNNAAVGTPTFAAPVVATINMPAANGFQVRVECGSALYREGETGLPNPNNNRMVRVYQITAFACPAGAAACPLRNGAAAANAYIERRRVAVGI